MTPSTRHRLRVLAVMWLGMAAAACAEGSFGANDSPSGGGADANSNAGPADAADAGTAMASDGGFLDSGGGDPGDASPASDADPDRRDGHEVDAVETGDGTSVGPCGAGCDAGRCEPETGQCVECLEDGDCPEGVCRPETNTCVECLDDEDCSGEGLCHEREPVCVEPCCSVTREDAFTEVGYAHDDFDIALDSADDPALLFADDDNEALKYARRTGGQWLSQTIVAKTISTTPDYALDLAPDDTPHVLESDYDELNHFWRPATDWNSENVIPSGDDVNAGYIDIVADTQGVLHTITLLEYGDEVLYRTSEAETAAGDVYRTVTEDYLSLPDFGDNGPVWVNLALTSDDRPIVSFQIGNEDVLVVAERSSGGTWSYETVGNDVFQIHGMDVGPDDEPIIAYRRQESDGLRILERDGSNWDATLLVDDPDHGYWPDIAVDSRGDPHIVYMADVPDDADTSMYYARFDGREFEHHPVPGIDRAFFPRIVLDETPTPHVAVYDSGRSTISYARIE